MSQLLKIINQLFSENIATVKDSEKLARHYDYDGAYGGM